MEASLPNRSSGFGGLCSAGFGLSDAGFQALAGPRVVGERALGLELQVGIYGCLTVYGGLALGLRV